MGNFTVTPANLEAAAKDLSGEIATAYGAAATNLRTNATVDAPGFGIALAWLDAMYRSRLDYIALDLDGAKDVTSDIGDALRTTAKQYAASEDLNVSGFGGPGQASVSFTDSLGGSLGSALPGGAIAGGIGLAAIYGTSATLAACAGLCPAFIPAAIAIPLLIANIPSIFEAAGTLTAQADNLIGSINIALASTLRQAADGWEGEGAKGFGEMSDKLTTHLSELTQFIDAVGAVLTSIGTTLSILWAALSIFAAAFLIWLIYMTGISIGPQAPAVQAIVQSIGFAASSAWMATLMTVLGGASAISVVIAALNDHLTTFLNVPDAGAQGTPDLQEFHIDGNFDVPL